MSSGLLALLDDVAAIAKVAAASLDDVAAQATKAGAKAAGVVIDDAAVTPRYVVGFTAQRELPIIAKITIGSLRNKLIFLLPAALLLGWLAPWAITPLLMIGGIYLCFEGAEKVLEVFFPHAEADSSTKMDTAVDAAKFENEKVQSAIRTDFILSAEIMAITLAAIPSTSVLTQAAILAMVGIGITLGVYGVVAIIVKADDFGLALARTKGSFLGLGTALRAFGRGVVTGMPYFLKALAAVGTAAMIWVGGGILVHGLETFGYGTLAHLIEDAAEKAAHAVPVAGELVAFLVSAAAAGLIGLAVGLATIPVVQKVVGKPHATS